MSRKGAKIIETTLSEVEIKSSSFNRFLGATLIVAGTTIGAGMLALPMTSATAGFLNSTLLLIGMWIFMCFTALVTLEINLYFGEGASIATLSEKVFGKYGKWIASASLLLLFYALLAAYITGGSSFLKTGIESYTGTSIPFFLLALPFTIGLGFFVNSCTQSVDYANRFIFLFKIIAFIAMVALLIPFVKTANLSTNQGNLSSMWLAAPIFFTSFGFHGSIPSLVNYIGPDPKALRSVIIIGSLIPLVVYLLWQTVTLGILPLSTVQSFGQENNAAVFIQHLNAITQKDTLDWLTNIFAFLAIATSFLGVAIGLFDYTAETFRHNNTPKQRFQTSLITFLPPLFFALFYPDGFILALGYAAIALSVLAVLIPIAISIRLRYLPWTGYKITTNIIILVIAFLMGVGIIAIEVMNWF
ncbi:MAG: aromatic amino acid transporter [Alphaproteobacteria bacterium]|nr:aromatic amino acid transporter [Alphaproteobacteria bacterium]